MSELTKPSYLRAFDEFLYKPAYFFLCAVLTIFANTCGAELFTYTCFILIGLYLCLFGRDLLPLLPLFVCSYIAPSRENNPGLNTESVFAPAKGGIYMIILASLLIVALIYRLIRDKELGRAAFFRCKRILIPGMLVLGAGYLLSGIGTAQFAKVGPQNLLFAFLQAAAIIVPYVVLTATVKWEKAPASYLSWTGMCAGYVLLAELAFIYLRYGIITEGIINRSKIFTGWGHYNNMGCLLAMMIPFPFSLTGKGKRTAVFYLSSLLFLAGVLFTCSRGSIICGAGIYVISYIVSLLYSRRARANVAIHSITALAIIALFMLFSERLIYMFQFMLEHGFESSARSTAYVAGWQQFLKYPIFGGTFYPVEVDLYTFAESEAFIAFFPPRWHNTIIQLLASCGIVGIAAYLFHRIQTLVLFLRRPSGSKTFVFLSVVVLLATSMIDCHFFNLGPVLFYSLALAFVEKKLNE